MPFSLFISAEIKTLISIECARHFGNTETARNGTKWDKINFGEEGRGRRAAQNLMTELSGLSSRSRQTTQRKFCVINTPFGLYQYNRMCFGETTINLLM